MCSVDIQLIVNSSIANTININTLIKYFLHCYSLFNITLYIHKLTNVVAVYFNIQTCYKKYNQYVQYSNLLVLQLQ